MKERVLLGMSGGTDSSVAALLLQEAGYEVIGVTFLFFGNAASEIALVEAAALAAQLGIEHFIHNASADFEREVIDYFVDEYARGRTPLPCVKCNNTLKWPLLCALADERGIEKIATGHYITLEEVNGYTYVAQGRDGDKDQSFFMWGVPEAIIRRMVMPLGHLTKEEVRNLARERGYERIATKRDSMGVCFCPDDYRLFIRARLAPNSYREGFFVDSRGEVIGQHTGHPFYTVGQRRGLGLMPKIPLFVRQIDVTTNFITLAPLSEMYLLSFPLSEVRVIDREAFCSEAEIICRIRYRKQANRCRVTLLAGGRARVEVEEPLESVAPGQGCAFYCGKRVVGGGIIEG